jgi:hypothetical protein
MYERDDEQEQQRFDEVKEVQRRKQYSTREVGLNHPDNHGFIRIADSGEIEIFAAPGVGIVINPSTRAISFFADSIKFYSREDDGLRWNNMSFNPAADVYNEPALIKTNSFSNNPAYYKTGYYLNNLENLDQLVSIDPVTIVGDYGLGGDSFSEGGTESIPTTISFEEERLLADWAKTNSDSEVILVREMLEAGYTFSEAIRKIKDKDYTMPEGTMKNFPWIENDMEEFPWLKDDTE